MSAKRLPTPSLRDAGEEINISKDGRGFGGKWRARADIQDDGARSLSHPVESKKRTSLSRRAEGRSVEKIFPDHLSVSAPLARLESEQPQDHGDPS
jgi:hypothetical protein